MHLPLTKEEMNEALKTFRNDFASLNVEQQIEFLYNFMSLYKQAISIAKTPIINMAKRFLELKNEIKSSNIDLKETHVRLYDDDIFDDTFFPEYSDLRYGHEPFTIQIKREWLSDPSWKDILRKEIEAE